MSTIKAKIDDVIHYVNPLKGETILDSLVRRGVDAPYSCQIGYCTTCKCRLLSGSVDDDSDMLSLGEKSEGFILSCKSIPLSDIDIDFDYL